MKTQDAVAKRILFYCRSKGLPIQLLARISAVPPSTLKNIINGISRNPGIVTIKKLCDGLEISLTEFFDDEIFRNLEQEIE